MNSNINQAEENHISITCKDCGKVNGHEKIGTSWICEDCKMDKFNTKEEK